MLNLHECGVAALPPARETIAMPHDLAQFAELINQAMAGDRYRLRRRLRAIEQAKKAGKPFDRSLDKLQQDLSISLEARTHRRDHVPKIELPEELPITARAQEIMDTVRDHQVVVVAGDDVPLVGPTGA